MSSATSCPVSCALCSRLVSQALLSGVSWLAFCSCSSVRQRRVLPHSCVILLFVSDSLLLFGVLSRALFKLFLGLCRIPTSCHSGETGTRTPQRHKNQHSFLLVCLIYISCVCFQRRCATRRPLSVYTCAVFAVCAYQHVEFDVFIIFVYVCVFATITSMLNYTQITQRPLGLWQPVSWLT